MPKRTDIDSVLIIGAGPTGLAAGLEFARRGITPATAVWPMAWVYSTDHTEDIAPNTWTVESATHAPSNRRTTNSTGDCCRADLMLMAVRVLTHRNAKKVSP